MEWCGWCMQKLKVFFCLCLACTVLIVMFSGMNRTMRGQVQMVWPAYQGAPEVGDPKTTAQFCVWRSNATKDGFYDTNEDCLLPQLRKIGFKVIKGFGKHHEKPRTEYERRMLSTPPLQDFRLAADELRSKVHVLSPRPFYHTGDRFQVRVDLYDGYGQPRTLGGDEIRMRLVSNSGHTVAADVRDLGNGSYLGTTLLPWNGTASAQVYLAFPRESFSEAIRAVLTTQTIMWIAAKYQYGSAKELTGCLPSFPIPGYRDVCNLTQFNGGLPYYCGRPTDKRLKCGHRKYLFKMGSLKRFPISSPGLQLLKKVNRSPSQRQIHNNVTIKILPANKTAKGHQDLIPCWKRSPESTWNSTAPRGWMSADHVWHPFTCSLPRQIEHGHVQQCLRNTSMFFVGDSNMRYWWYGVLQHLSCSKLEIGSNIHLHKLCEVRSSNTTLRWAFHARPSYTNPVSDNVPLPTLLARLRHDPRHNRRRLIVVVHYYLHFTVYSLGFYQGRVRAARRQIQQFLQEFPETKFIIRGPHLKRPQAIGGPMFAPAYIQIWHDEFRELRDRVWFLDFWDMTIATQNVPSHPPPHVIRAMVNVFLGHICDNFPPPPPNSSF
ncbi:NXPE family member 1-like isoform X2 [Babylonia areolata]|uniref:NXPE family member 1-like isoform X2 n=1 Tax=Babylonia areolata TaxID=304850 RepID=UPI003FD513BD